MKRQKGKKRYTSREQIISDIDKWHRKIQALLDSANQLEMVAREYYQSGICINLADFNMIQAEKKRKSAMRIKERKLVHLKNKLSEFMTPPLPNCGIEDNSIQST